MHASLIFTSHFDNLHHSHLTSFHHTVINSLIMKLIHHLHSTTYVNTLQTNFRIRLSTFILIANHLDIHSSTCFTHVFSHSAGQHIHHAQTSSMLRMTDVPWSVTFYTSTSEPLHSSTSVQWILHIKNIFMSAIPRDLVVNRPGVNLTHFQFTFVLFALIIYKNHKNKTTLKTHPTRFSS